MVLFNKRPFALSADNFSDALAKYNAQLSAVDVEGEREEEAKRGLARNVRRVLVLAHLKQTEAIVAIFNAGNKEKREKE